MKIGLVGLPQTGKKTLFTLLTGTAPDTEKLKKGMLPGSVTVRDGRFDRLVEMYEPKKQVAAAVEFLLFPDFEKQAAQNDALFRSLQNADVICHLVRAFNDDSVFHIEGSVDAERDIGMFNSELLLHDLVFIEKRLARLAKDKGNKDAALKEKEKKLLEKMLSHLEGDSPLRLLEFTEEEKTLIISYPFMTRKEMIVILNVGEEGLNDEAFTKGLEEKFAASHIYFIPISVKIEQELDELDSAEEKEEFLSDLGITTPALERLTRFSYEALGLIPFFTVGKDEVRAWMVKKDSPAPKAARVIHNDFEKGFIRAEVIAYDDLIELGSEAKVKDAGKLMVKGKDYIVQDGDILHFLFNV